MHTVPFLCAFSFRLPLLHYLSRFYFLQNLTYTSSMTQLELRETIKSLPVEELLSLREWIDDCLEDLPNEKKTAFVKEPDRETEIRIMRPIVENAEKHIKAGNFSKRSLKDIASSVYKEFGHNY